MSCIEPEQVDPIGPVTKLRLKLHGVFVSSERGKGSAIIADGSKQVLYAVGEEIENANFSKKENKISNKKKNGQQRNGEMKIRDRKHEELES
eukprot:TRINITY_DN4430_c0_g3_i1.p2 TRINITY_DN4430_c0_g3~~TRINITY_DN4430_c0_g3_i1.p2  ORF type:complete len:108 (+),score=9.23 TRINITY_DN4430_c0_g3_i1:49-324(+)